MTLPKVSVIIPCYNGERYLQETLNSVYRQRYPALLLEIIVVDDGSTDNSVKIAERYTGIRVIRHETNRGPCAACDTGYAAATGKYICMCAADDRYLDEYHIADQVAVMELSEAGWCYNSVNVVGELPILNQTVESKWLISNRLDPLILKFPQFCYLLLGIRNPVNSGAMMVRALDIRAHGITWSKWGNRSICDAAFISQMLKAGMKGTVLRNPSVFYRIHPAQISKNAVFTHREWQAKNDFYQEIVDGDYPFWMKWGAKAIMTVKDI